MRPSQASTPHSFSLIAQHRFLQKAMHPHLPVVNFCTVIRSEEQRALRRSCIRRQWKSRSEKFLSERKKIQCHRKIRMYGIGKHRADVSRPVTHHNPEVVSVLLIWALCCLIVNATVVYSYYTFTFSKSLP